jgi:hypothetical protein
MTLPPLTVSLTVSILSLSLAVLAFVIAIKNYRRKTGVNVRGVFTTGSAMACNDVFVTEVILENLKDRAVTIFAIYLKIGHNYYVELENLEEKPLVLKAFETYRREFGPIEFYGINDNKIRINNLLGDRRVKGQEAPSVVDLRRQVSSPIKHSPLESDW